MNYKDLIVIIIKVVGWLLSAVIKVAPCVIVCMTEIDKAKQDDDSVDPVEVSQIIQKTGECLQKQFNAQDLIAKVAK